MNFIRIIGKSTLVIINLTLAVLLLISAYAYVVSPGNHILFAYFSFAFPFLLLINIPFIFLWVLLRKWFFLISFFAIALSLGSVRNWIPVNITTATASGEKLRILTYNVHDCDNYTAVKSGSKNAIIEYVKEQNADIVCLQEFTDSKKENFISVKQVTKYLRNQYPYYHYFPVNYAGTYRTGLLCLSRYPIQEVKKVEFSSVGNAAVCYRLEVGKESLTLINCHLESNKFTLEDKHAYAKLFDQMEEQQINEVGTTIFQKMGEAYKIRAVQADSINALVRRTPGRVMVCGDFNDTPLSYAYNKIKRGLNDAYVETGSGIGITYHSNRFLVRIDHILYSKGLVAISSLIDKGIKISDHYPVQATLVWEAEKE